MYLQFIQQFLTFERLPDSYAEEAEKWFFPFISDLENKVRQLHDRPLLLGINGAQGTGKSTLAKLITLVMQQQDYRVANLSLDDFYLDRKTRKELAVAVHPLLRTRGVPGTHDTALLDSTLTRLLHAAEGDCTVLPRFDKSSDDRVPASEFAALSGPVDLIILEGWFIGVQPEASESLKRPINQLEAEEDADLRWRHYVNDSLQRDYLPIFDRLDQLTMLLAPSFRQVYEWRGLQEAKLKQSSGADGPGVMSPEQLGRFIQHYERLTRHCLASLPLQADTVFELDADHRVTTRKDKPAAG